MRLQSTDQKRLLAAVVLSAVAHGVLLLLIKIPRPELSSPRLPLSIVTLPPLQSETKKEENPRTPEVPLPERQIVSPSAASKAEPVKTTRLLSDESTRTGREQVKRGVPEPAGAREKPSLDRARPATAPRPQLERNTHASSEKRFPSLRLDESVLAKRFSRGDGGAPQTLLEASPAREKPPQFKLEDYEPFRRGGGVLSFTGPVGSPDYLPEIPDGDITLLNAKADRFAVFVRRVALQVFGGLRQRHWQQLTASEVRKIRNFTLVEGVMNRSGELVRVEVVESSGNSRFDALVVDSVRNGMWDQNPPPGAVAADGEIHFLFRAKTWTRPGTGRNFEQRWLLLGTALR